MALNKIYGEMEKNKIKDKKYSILLAEAKEQCEEFKDVLEEFGIEDEEEDDD